MPAQSILCIDASVHPAWLQVSEVEGRTVTVVESLRSDLGDMFNPKLLKELLATSSTNGSSPPPAESPAAPQEASETTEHAPQSNGSLPHFGACAARLKAALSQLTRPYSAAVLVVPATDYLSLNLDLPFSDSRQISKIIDLEVQDRVPFEIDEFIIEHRALSAFPTTSSHRGHDVHVSILPRPLMSAIVRICKGASFEPLIITTVNSILEGMFFLAPDYFKSDAAAILVREQLVYVALRFDNRVRVDRIIDVNSLSSDPDERAKALSTELRLTLMAAETRYERKIEQVYLVGEEFHERALQQYLGREVELVRLNEIMTAPPQEAAVASLAAPFALDVAPPPILTNFRVKEFSYSLQLSELFGGLRRLFPMSLVLLLTFIVYLVGSYYNREMQIHAMQEEMRATVAKVMPDIQISEGSEVSTVNAENSKLDKALEGLGSGALDKLTALDILREIAIKLPTSSDIQIQRVWIHGNKITLEGTAPNYKEVESIQKALERTSTIKFRVRAPEISGAPGFVPGGSKSTQKFTFDITVVE